MVFYRLQTPVQKKRPVRCNTLQLSMEDSIQLPMRLATLLGVSCFWGFVAYPQQPAPDPTTQPGTLAKSNPGDDEPKRILGIVPNYRTFPSLTNYEPISAKEKFVIATQDSFDRGT